MKKILSLVSIFLIGTSIQAQEGGHHCSRLKSHSILNQSRSNTLGLDYIALTEEYDVNFYFLDVNLERTATDEEEAEDATPAEDAAAESAE